jgi:hypothetical protein
VTPTFKNYPDKIKLENFSPGKCWITHQRSSNVASPEINDWSQAAFG